MMIIAAFVFLFMFCFYFAGVDVEAGALGADGAAAGVLVDEDESGDDVLAGLLSPEALLPSPEVDFAAALLP